MTDLCDPPAQAHPEAPAGRPGPPARLARAAAARLRGLPPWAQVLAGYGLTRLFGAFLLQGASRLEPAGPWSDAGPGYFGMVGHWDGAWFGRAALEGYPQVLPLDGAGDVAQNTWAFLPLLPALGRAVMAVTGVSWPVAASTVALLAGAGAVVVLRSLLAPLVGPTVAGWSVVLVCCFPSAVVLQVAYSESPALLLLASVLLCLQRGRYLLAAPLLLLAGLTRPIGVPLAVVVVLHVVRRCTGPRHGGVPDRTVAAALLLALVSVFAAVLWPLVALVRTRSLWAYPETMAAWRGSDRIEPLRPWLTTSRYLLGDLVGPVLLASAVAALVVWVAGPSGRRLGADLRTWCLAYAGYLLLVLDPTTSLPRYLLMLFPLGTLTAAASRSTAYRRAVAVAFLAGQVVWVFWLWHFSPPTDPPP